MSRMSLVAIGLVVTAVGCGEDATGPTPRRPVLEVPTPQLVFEALSPTDIEGVVGTAVLQEPTVIVKDAGGIPLANVLVKFAVVSDELGVLVGSLSRADALTNAEGIATAGEWTLSTTAGPNSLQASIVGAEHLMFRAVARPDAPVSLGWLSDMEGQVGVAGMTTQPPRLQVRDRFGNSVAGVHVTFAITAGGGTLEGTQMVTADYGSEALGWTLGANPGVNTITASALGLGSIEFTIEAIEANTIYDFTMVEGVGWDVASAFVAFTDDGRFVSHAKYGEGWLWVVSGTYVISGSTVVLTYPAGDEEMGTLVDGVLVLDRWDNPCAPARQWHYHLRG